MTKETKIGLTVLTLLALVFGTLLFRKLVAFSTPANAESTAVASAADSRPKSDKQGISGVGKNLRNRGSRKPAPPVDPAPAGRDDHNVQTAAGSEPIAGNSPSHADPFHRSADLDAEREDQADLSGAPRVLPEATHEATPLESAVPTPARPRNPLRRVSAQEPLDSQAPADDLSQNGATPLDSAPPDAAPLETPPVEVPAAEPLTSDPPAEEAPLSPTPEPQQPPAETPSDAGFDQPQQPLEPVQVPRERPYERRQPAPPVEPVIPENGKYTVQPNDSLSLISEKVYGNSRYFKALAEYNRRGLPNPDQLTVGTVIAVPPATVLEQTYPALCPKQRKSAIVKSRTLPASTQPVARGGNIYVVEEGDTLFDIARYELGKASRWSEIYELNRDTLGSDFDYLQPGTELVMPAKPGGDSMTRARDSRYQRERRTTN